MGTTIIAVKYITFSEGKFVMKFLIMKLTQFIPVSEYCFSG